MGPGFRAPTGGEFSDCGPAWQQLLLAAEAVVEDHRARNRWMGSRLAVEALEGRKYIASALMQAQGVAAERGVRILRVTLDPESLKKLRAEAPVELTLAVEGWSP
jgi:hypothetical protein